MHGIGGCIVAVLLGVSLQYCWVCCNSYGGCVVVVSLSWCVAVVILGVLLQYYWVFHCSIAGCVVTVMVVVLL